MKIIDREFLFFIFTEVKVFFIEIMFFLDALSSKEEEPILVLDDSTKIFEIEEDYIWFLEDSGSEINAEAGIYNCVFVLH